jgi:hypothetical protein
VPEIPKLHPAKPLGLARKSPFGFGAKKFGKFQPSKGL